MKSFKNSVLVLAILMLVACVMFASCSVPEGEADSSSSGEITTNEEGVSANETVSNVEPESRDENTTEKNVSSEETTEVKPEQTNEETSMETNEDTSEETTEEASEAIEDYPAWEVKDYTLFLNKEGTARLEAEEVDVTHYVKSSDNPTIVVERDDASGGKFLAAATGAIASGQYFEFRINLRFNAEIIMTVAYAQTNKWKSYDEDLTKSYTYIVDENRNMAISPDKTVLAAREDITKWDTFTYCAVTLPAGEHTIRVSVAENTGNGNPNIDYLDFAVKRVDEVPDNDKLTVPANDFHTPLQYAYLNDPNLENVEAYAKGVAELSRPNAITLDFSADVEDSDSYVIQYADNADFLDAVTVTGLTGKVYGVYDLKLGQKVYWRGGVSEADLASNPVHELTVVTQGPRNLYIDGMSNVRDIGGYASSLVEGGVIRQGLYFRGANPEKITKNGKQEMLRLGVRVEIDLRDSYQCKGPYINGVDYYAISIPSGTESTRFEAFKDEYKQIFTLIANAGEKPVYLHCTAGADRTGISTFILLTVCGVDYDDIARDYLFTNFSTQGSRVSNFTTEFKQWWSKLDKFEGDTKAEKAKAWLISKGVTEEQVETIRETFVVGYTSGGAN